ncbi:MAG: hypothetical protein SFU98_11795 [Leptospiraceae bacterium]|nr:hypothetical protein [Leptospiraceae bacterium]
MSDTQENKVSELDDFPDKRIYLRKSNQYKNIHPEGFLVSKSLGDKLFLEFYNYVPALPDYIDYKYNLQTKDYQPQEGKIIDRNNVNICQIDAGVLLNDELVLELFQELKEYIEENGIKAHGTED